MVEQPKKISRRSFLKVGAGVAVAAAIAGVGAYEYMATRPAPPAAKKPIRVGHLADLTGTLAVYGYSHDKTLKAAVQKINAEGGISGRQVELFTEDSASDPSTGATKMRKLLEFDNVDFVIGSQHSGVDIATNPVAKQGKTTIWQVGSAESVTGKDGSRYVFRVSESNSAEIHGMIPWLKDNFGKKWATFVADYAAGIQIEDAFTKYAPPVGISILKKIRAPLSTTDFLPYANQVPSDTEAVFIGFFGAPAISLIKSLHTVRPNTRKVMANYVLTGIDTKALGDAVEGDAIVGGFPRRLEAYNTPYTVAFRKAIGVNDEGQEIGNPKNFYALSFDWVVWENIFAIKAGIEKSGWSSKNDNPALIRALEGMNLKESNDFPQGDDTIRAADHQGLSQIFIEQVRNGELQLAARIKGENASIPATVDYTQESF